MAVSQNLNILIVDETKTRLMSVKEILSNTGFKNINYAFSGEDALSKLQESVELDEPVQLVICSHEMSGMSGVQVFSKIGENNHLSNTPFLLLCGNSDKDQILTAIKSGVRNILLRPFSKQSLINELVKIFN